jgi:hypothetical protein
VGRLLQVRLCSEPGHYSEYYSPETQAIVADRERLVIERFVYTFEQEDRASLRPPTPFKSYL